MLPSVHSPLQERTQERGDLLGWRQQTGSTHPRGLLLSVGVFVPSQSFKTVGGRERDFFLL